MNEKIIIEESVMINVEGNNNENGECIILEPGDVIELLPPDDLELDEFPYSDSERILREQEKKKMGLTEEEKKQYAQRVQKRMELNETQEKKPYKLEKKIDPNSYIETREKKYESFHKGDSELMNNKTKKEK